MFKEFSLTAFPCVKKIFSQFYGTTKWNAQHHEGSLWCSWEMNSDFPVSVQNLNYVIISCLISNSSLEVEWVCHTAFFISFLLSLLIAWGIGGEWSFYMLGVFFNTVLLSLLFLFCFPSYIPSHVKSSLSSLLHLKCSFLYSYIYLPTKVSSLSSILML